MSFLTTRVTGWADVLANTQTIISRLLRSSPVTTSRAVSFLLAMNERLDSGTNSLLLCIQERNYGYEEGGQSEGAYASCKVA